MNENVNVCITPKGEKPVLHFSQFDNENVFTVTVLADDGESAAVLTGLDIEFRLRKTDSHVVTIAPESVTDNVITFKTTEQMCACCGQNIATVTLMKDDMIISTLDILVDIQRDILSGGLTSESDIRNLTTQIEQIVPEVIGDDYYTKTEVDDLIADIPTFDPTNYYNKTDVDGLLDDKADADDVYTKTETDNLLADKADKSDTYTKSAVDSLLMDRMGNIEFIAWTPGAYHVISFNSSYNAPIISIAGEITSSTSTINLIRCGVNRIQLDNDDNPQKSYFTYTYETPEKIAGTKNHASNMFFYAFETYVVSGRHYFFQFDHYLINGSDSNCNVYLYSDNILGTSIGSFAIPAAGYDWTSNYTGRILIGIYGIGGLSTTFEIDKFMVSEGNSAVTYVPYIGELKTITLGQTVSSGSIDFTHGTVTDSGNIITFTPVTLDAVIGVNNVFIDVGNLTTLTYVSDADYGLMTLLEAYTKR